MYLPNAAFVNVTNNVIADGYCPTCENKHVWGFELGPEKQLRNVRIANNYMYNQHGGAAYFNEGGGSTSNLQFISNAIYGFTFAVSGDTAAINSSVISENAFGDLKPSLNRDGRADYTIYRVVFNGKHQETNNSSDSGRVTAKVENSL